MSWTNADSEKLLKNPAIISWKKYGTGDAFVDVLGVDSLKYDVKRTGYEFSFDDVGVVQKGVADETVELSASIAKVLDFDAVDALTGSLMTKSTVAGTIVEDQSQVVAAGNWAYDKVIVMEYQNADLSEISISSVVAGTNGALVEDTDYFKVLLDGVGWGIYVIESATVLTENQSITIVYDYTPAASTVHYSGGLTTITPLVVKITLLDDDSNTYVYEFFKCFADGNFGHGFGSEKKMETIMLNLKLTAEKDTNLDAGKQLFKRTLTPALSS
jgi:hypothetical protein